MPKYTLRAAAKKDLKDIARYTRKKWSIKQRNKYLYALEERLQWLADNPNPGIPRDDLMEGVMSKQHEKHIIIYRRRGEDIEIGRIFGPGMNIELHFQRDNPF